MAFLKGLIFGLAIAAPVGPIGLLCIRRSVTEGFASGFATGMGAAAADGVYAVAAAIGFVALAADHAALRLFGAALLLWLAWGTWRAGPAAVAEAAPSRGRLLLAFGGTFLLTLSNPMTILSFVAIFAGAGLGTMSRLDAAALVGGVFLGSALWHFGLAASMSRLRHRLTPAAHRWINRASALALAGFAIAILRPLVARLA